MRRTPALFLAFALGACTTPARTDSASVPALPATTATRPAPGPAASAATTTTTTAPAAEGPDIVAWLRPGAPGSSLAETISAWEGIGSVDVVDGRAALAEFARLFPDQPALTAGVPAEALPASLRIELEHPSHLGEVAGSLRSLSDVAEVATAVTPECNSFSDWNVVVFADDDRQLTRLRNLMLEIGGLTEVSVVSREDAHAEFVARFGPGEITDGVAVEDLLVSLRARTTDPDALQEAAAVFSGDGAVRAVHLAPAGAPACL